MTAPEPNAAQQRLIDGTEGVYLVDAGAGTGKTLAVTRRYANIIDQARVEPEDVLLVTFTRSAATEMKERIVEHSTYGLKELADAPIQTFHAHCHTILQEHGYDAPTHLGIDDRITGSTRVIEDELVESALFGEFIGQFQDAHPEYTDQFRAIEDPGSLLGLINQLAAKGIFPTTDGWYRDSESHLDGDWEAFRDAFDELNQPRNDGRKQSELRAKLGGYESNKTYLPNAPSKVELRGGRGTKQVEPSIASRVFEADRKDLKGFVHDVYVGYLEFALERNYLNYGFLQLFAFVVLMEDHDLRDRLAFEYVMVDEFQDTSEIQFTLALLLAGTENLCVVGDWKQSIYSFQYADVENILAFEDRLDRFSQSLNADADRVSVPTEDITRIEFEENYRSTQTLLDFSENALVTPATEDEILDDSILDTVVSLSANANFDESTIEAIQHEDEHEAVLAKIQEIVGNDAYPVGDEDGNPRPPDYGDITVLTRTRDYGRELLQVAEAHDFPMAYDGGVELFRTDPAKLLLAWLRILEDEPRGWAVVLERAGYTQEQIAHLLESEAYPSNMTSFRADLAELESVAAVARRVFDRYGFDGEYADVILDTVQSVHDTTTLTRGDLIQFITRAIETGATHEVHTSAGEDAVTVQTIHAAKGLEYPIVILANMNEGKFPPRSRNADIVRYDEHVGLRQRKRYAEVGAHPHVYTDWRYDVFRHCLPDGYDEERRLLYVAITRAEDHVVFAAGEEPNAFMEGLPVDIEQGPVEVSPVERGETTQVQLPFSISPPDGPIKLTPHQLMDDSVFESDRSENVETVEVGIERESDQDDGRGFGSEVHDFAEAYARGADVEPANGHEQRIGEFIHGLDGELFVEEPALLPMDVDGTQVIISGVVDLVNLTDGTVEIVDYKTDSSRRAESEYRKQLSTYHHVLAAEYPDREVTPSIYYTSTGDLVQIDPLGMDAIEDLVRDRLAADADE